MSHSVLRLSLTNKAFSPQISLELLLVGAITHHRDLVPLRRLRHWHPQILAAYRQHRAGLGALCLCTHPRGQRRRKNGTARRAAPLVPRVLHGPEQGMAVETYLHPGGQLLAGPRPPHRAALPHRQCRGAALNARGPDISRGAQTTRPWTGPALGLGLLRRLRRPRRRLMGRRSDSGGLGFEPSGGPCPSAI